jgi:hypothetical protein
LVKVLDKVDKIRVTLMRAKKSKLTETDRQTNLKELIAKERAVTISLVMTIFPFLPSVRPSLRLHGISPFPLDMFCEILNLNIFPKSIWKFQISLKSGKNVG